MHALGETQRGAEIPDAPSCTPKRRKREDKKRRAREMKKRRVGEGKGKVILSGYYYEKRT
jgi:hypothetical protein